jgi:hypothetical protein
MEKGSYRIYFKIPFLDLGVKIPRFEGVIPFAIFLCGMIMNIYERKRYQYYVLKKTMKQWNRKWVYEGETPKFNPTYFSFFGLLNIVKHVDICKTEKEVCLTDKETAYISSDISKRNIGICKNGEQVLIDYGDFNVDRYNRNRIGLIDYK